MSNPSVNQSFLDSDDEFPNLYYEVLSIDIINENEEESETEFFQSNEKPNFEDMLFYVTDIYHTKNKREVILRLYDSPEASNFIVRLRGMWVNLYIKIGDPVFVHSTFDDKCETVIDNEVGFIVSWPLLMISATRLSSATFCSRKAVLYPIIPAGIETTIMTVGTISHEIIQALLTNELTTATMRAESEKLIENKALDTSLQGASKETIKESLHTVFNRAEQIALKDINAPPYGCDVIEKEESLLSSRLGLIGKADITLCDPKDNKILPLEMKSGKSFNDHPKNGHKSQLFTYMMLMKEKYKEKAADYGMLYYMEDNSTFKLKYNRFENAPLVLLRNFIVGNSTHGKLPGVKRNKKGCENCDFKDTCFFLHDIEDTDMEKSSTPKFTQNQIKFFKMLDEDLINKIFTKTYLQYESLKNNVKVREKAGTALSNLSLEKIGDKIIRFHCDPFLLQLSKFDISSYVILTKNGNFPIIGTGYILEISYEGFIFARIEEISEINDHNSDFCLDLLPSINDQILGRQSIINFFVYSSALQKRNLFSYFLKGIQCKINKTPKNSKIFGLNREQEKAVLNSLRSKYFSVINGVKSSGKTHILSLIIHHFESSHKKVLITGPSDEAIDFLCSCLVDSIDFVRVSTSYIRNAKIREHSISQILAEHNDNHNIKSVLDKYHIFAASIDDCQHQYIISTQFDVLVVDDCENIKMQNILGPICLCKKFILCGNMYSIHIKNSIFHFINNKLINNLAIQYTKISEIHNLENSLIYNYSSPTEINHPSKLLYLNKLDSFSPLFSKWILPILSNNIYTIFLDEKNYVMVESYTIAFILISWIICGLLPESIGVMCYQKKNIYMIKESIKTLLSMLPVDIKNKFNLPSEDFQFEIHYASNYREEVDYQGKNCSNVIVSIGTYLSQKEELKSIGDIQNSLFEAHERLYLIGYEKDLKNNPFFEKIVKITNASGRIPDSMIKMFQKPCISMFESFLKSTE